MNPAKDVWQSILQYIHTTKFPQLRLISKNTNKGIDAIYKEKVRTKGYMKTFLKSTTCSLCRRNLVITPLIYCNMCGCEACPQCWHDNPCNKCSVCKQYTCSGCDEFPTMCDICEKDVCWKCADECEVCAHRHEH